MWQGGGGEAQGGCACCAVRGSKWVEGWRGVRHRAAAPAVRLGGASGWQGGASVRHRAAAPAVRLGRAMVRRALGEMVRY